MFKKIKQKILNKIFDSAAHSQQKVQTNSLSPMSSYLVPENSVHIRWNHLSQLSQPTFFSSSSSTSLTNSSSQLLHFIRRLEFSDFFSLVCPVFAFLGCLSFFFEAFSILSRFLFSFASSCAFFFILFLFQVFSVNSRRYSRHYSRFVFACGFPFSLNRFWPE